MRPVLLLFLALVIIVSACTRGGEEPIVSDKTAFIGGSDGIKLNFVTNAPPDEVTDKLSGEEGFPFNVIVTAENVGEYSIDSTDLAVSLSGFFPSDFNVPEENSLRQTYYSSLGCSDGAATAKFEGVKKSPDGSKIQGAINQFSFPFVSASCQAAANTQDEFLFNKELKGTQQFPFRAEACYYYSTKALSQICLLKELTNDEGALCSPSGSRNVDNSGAPIHVVSVKQSVGGKNKAILNIKISKVGDGDIFLGKGTVAYNKCDSDFSNKDRIKAKVETGLGEENLPNCLGLLNKEADVPNEGQLLLDNGEAEFTCIQETTAVDSLKSIEITLRYWVKESIEKQVTVKHLIG